MALVLLIALSALAAVNAVYLTLVHLDAKLGTGELQALCHVFSATGCAVTAGRFGSLFGTPIAVFGLAGAVTTMLFGVFAWLRRKKDVDPARGILLVLSAFAVVASVVMAGLSFLEASFCPFCVVWYGINGALLACAWVARDRNEGALSKLARSLPRWGLRAATIFIVTLVLSQFAYRSRASTLLAQRQEEVREGIPAFIAEVVKRGPVTVGLADAPVHGNAETSPPEVSIIEFGDFQCPHCKTLFEGLEAYLEKTERAVEIRFAHYPLDSACNPLAGDLHPFACDAARAAVCAQRQGKFFPYARAIFAHQEDLSPERLRASAATAGLSRSAFEGCMNSAASAEAVARDIQRGSELRIAATPTFFVNGYRIDGGIPPDLVETVVEGILNASGERPNSPAAAPTAPVPTAPAP